MERSSSPAATEAGRLDDILDMGAEAARVLVVDDDERNLLAITHVLQDLAEVVVARSGEEALRHLLRTDFSVILLDVFMPGMDGYETAQMIRSREQTRRVPIVFLSAVNKENEHLLRGYALGAVDYVFKPVEPVVLRSKVAVFVDLFTMNKEIERKARKEQALLDAALEANAERLRAEKDLRLVEQRQAAIIQSLPIILYLEELNASPRVPKFVSGNFDALTGFSFEEIQRSPNLWVDRLHPDDRERVLEAVAERPTGRSLSVEYRWQCADGEYRHFIDQAVLLRDPDGRPVEYAGTLFDVTERKDLENQLNQVRKMDAIGQLTGGIAHDFNNLLAAVLGGLGMIERRVQLDDRQLKIVEMMRHAAEQGAELVKHLLAFARRQKLAPAVIEVDELATSVTRLLDHTLGGLVELQWDVQGNTADVYADSAQLELALMNLIINARDAMPEGGTISVRVSNVEIGVDQSENDLASGRYVAFAVSDTGCGIASHLLDQVMEPFFTTKAVGKGTGLGLSMVYGFAQQSGGTVRVRSEVGVGTCVEMWLPEAPTEREPDLALPLHHIEAEPQNSLKILLVDDHDGVRATTASLLEDMGHRVTDVADGLSALDLIRGALEPFDLLVTDYAMPRISGTQLVKGVRDLRPCFPAVIITGYADARELLGNGLDVAVVEKPFTPEKLGGALRDAVAIGGTEIVV